LKYALVNNDKVEDIKGTNGICPNCGSVLIARVPLVRVSEKKLKK